jgi:four helix bundle protein
MRDEARTATPGLGQAYERFCVENHWSIREPKTTEAQVMVQVLRSGTSVGAHYREARRAKSDADLLAKLKGRYRIDETAHY